MLACVPSIFEESTASRVVKGDSNNPGFGSADKVPSYLAKALLARPIAGMRLSQFTDSMGSFRSVAVLVVMTQKTQKILCKANG